jgi:hypothetical protein
MSILFALDLAAMVTAIAASYLWWRASCSTMRRIGKTEEFNHQDLNRVIVSFNRTQILNSRAALATAVSALIVALRYAASAYGGG